MFFFVHAIVLTQNTKTKIINNIYFCIVIWKHTAKMHIGTGEVRFGLGKAV
jgi:hypothetical protein